MKKLVNLMVAFMFVSLVFTMGVGGFAPTARPDSTNTTICSDKPIEGTAAVALRLHWATTQWRIRTFGPIGFAEDGEGLQYVAVGPRWYMVGK